MEYRVDVKESLAEIDNASIDASWIAHCVRAVAERLEALVEATNNLAAIEESKS